MAYTNRQYVAPDSATYPELRPVTQRQSQQAPQQQVQSQNRKHTTRAEYLFYLAVNIALVFGVVQCARTVIGDTLNIGSLAKSQSTVQQFYTDTRHENQALNDKIRVYSSRSGIEELARNYLNMVGDNELPFRFQ